ncbi:hypothetical protein ACFFSY_28395 [Paenibacillus aurantiacus]|uniref:Lipoprotein n=1 Tax=Paenibacillus aurantiacus TaxID=1936118 RepID=A0ABV5KXC2_9BACL
MRLTAIILLCCTLLAAAGCTASQAVRTDEVKAFEQQIQDAYPSIEAISVKFTDTTLVFHYLLKGQDDEQARIFQDSRTFFLSSEVQQKLVKERFVKEHAERNFSYPDVEISFSLTDNNTTDFKYTASYYRSSTDPSLLDEYKTWYYVDRDGKTVQVDS